jgi:hypothetical protein
MIKIFLKYLFLLGFVTGLTYCQRKTLNKQELLKYINLKENGVSSSHVTQGIEYKLTYRPLDFIIEQELHADPTLSHDSLRNVYSDRLYFVLSVSQDSSELFSHRRPDFEDLLKKFSFGLSEVIRLNMNEIDYYVSDFVYPRMYASTNSTSVLICFKDKQFKSPNDFKFCVKDFVNNSPEEIKFQFFSDDINNIPNLKL